MPGGQADRGGLHQPYFDAAFYPHPAPAYPGSQHPSYPQFPPQLDRGMLEEYRRKMDHLQRQFDAQLRPKLDELKRQVVTVEERIREVSETRDLLLSEAITEHQVLPRPHSTCLPPSDGQRSANF